MTVLGKDQAGAELTIQFLKNSFWHQIPCEHCVMPKTFIFTWVDRSYLHHLNPGRCHRPAWMRFASACREIQQSFSLPFRPVEDKGYTGKKMWQNFDIFCLLLKIMMSWEPANFLMKFWVSQRESPCKELGTKRILCDSNSAILGSFPLFVPKFAFIWVNGRGNFSRNYLC